MQDDKEEMLSRLLFPYNTIRQIQGDMLIIVSEALKAKKSIIINAPTGIGKTAAVIAPAIKTALDNELTVFFITSRHTQHQIAVKTLSEIREKYATQFNSADIIGKKWMCAVPGIEKMYASEFAKYCMAVKEQAQCEFFSRTKNSAGKLTEDAKAIVANIKNNGPQPSESVNKQCLDKLLCPYEITLELASNARIIIADYYYIFQPKIRSVFFNRTKKELAKSIIIIDEAHNLPARVRDVMTEMISTITIARAIGEAKKYRYKETESRLQILKSIFNEYEQAIGSEQEIILKKEEFISQISKLGAYEEIAADFELIGDEVRKNERQSSIGVIGNFLLGWPGPDQGFARILSKKPSRNGIIIMLSYRCLDPSIFTKDVLNEAYASILMSGTLNPTEMYRDVLGMPKNTLLNSFKSHFQRLTGLP